MGNVKYKKPPESMNRMITKPSTENRLSIGMSEVKGEIYYLSPELIISFKNQARKEIDENLLNELALSIQAHGIIQPLQIIPSDTLQGKFEVVSGERRLNAARKIGLNKVPCMILDRDKDSEEIALIENIQRVDLHPIELADAVEKTLSNKKYGSQVELAERIGVSKQKITHLLAISRLPQDVKEHLLHQKDIKMGFLKSIAYLKDTQSIRDKVFNSLNKNDKFSSLLRLSFNGSSFRSDYSKIDKLDNYGKELLKNELQKIIQHLEG
ncbi:ParB/RepB/Spo0J family partition protein [Candidatus Odyssella thessalonicensis]|uniref:ParB/RepB/Spo0J family partition protein n=1 Tax=Candidatus Odyssella thessalonicensis TaxID=84647 RepID=UPI000225AF55|nr:ParB/RepB/Spo0J family partition protein [Candidatus Odyssella thessalonicensis]